MEETLERLKDQGHDLYLYTGGDRHVQSEKIRQLRLDRYFGKNVFITRHKTEKVLDRLVDELGFHRPSTWMIGNSLKTDVVPALKAKIHSIYVPAALEWEFNITHVDVEPQGAFITVEALNEVPPAIHGYLNSSKNGAVGL